MLSTLAAVPFGEATRQIQLLLDRAPQSWELEDSHRIPQYSPSTAERWAQSLLPAEIKRAIFGENKWRADLSKVYYPWRETQSTIYREVIQQAEVAVDTFATLQELASLPVDKHRNVFPKRNHITRKIDELRKMDQTVIKLKETLNRQWIELREKFRESIQQDPDSGQFIDFEELSADKLQRAHQDPDLTQRFALAIEAYITNQPEILRSHLDGSFNREGVKQLARTVDHTPLQVALSNITSAEGQADVIKQAYDLSESVTEEERTIVDTIVSTWRKAYAQLADLLGDARWKFTISRNQRKIWQQHVEWLQNGSLSAVTWIVKTMEGMKPQFSSLRSTTSSEDKNRHIIDVWLMMRKAECSRPTPETVSYWLDLWRQGKQSSSRWFWDKINSNYWQMAGASAWELVRSGISDAIVSVNKNATDTILVSASAAVLIDSVSIAAMKDAHRFIQQEQQLIERVTPLIRSLGRRKGAAATIRNLLLLLASTGTQS